MMYRHFEDYVRSLDVYHGRMALTLRPFLKIEHVRFEQLQERAYKTANFLLAKQIKPHDRIMVIAPNSPAWVELFLGAQLIGAIIVPVDVTNTPESVEGFIGQTTPKLIFKGKRLMPKLKPSDSVLLLDDLDVVIATFPATSPERKPEGSDVSVIVFTSGTTAAPKGVELTQANILANVEGVQRALTIDPDWRLLSVLPLSHMYELTGGCLAPLSRGTSLYYMPRVTPLAIARALEDYRITTMLAIPQLLTLLMDRIQQTAEAEGKAKVFKGAMQVARVLPLWARRQLFRSVHKRLGGKLSLFVTGGAPIPKEVAVLWERLGVKVIQGYGLTETSPILTVNRLNERRYGSAGYALHNVRLRIGTDNEIQAKGPNVFMAYYHNLKATRAAFTSDGWFKTGDTGRLKDGWLYIQGRLKFAIVLSSGLKVFPEDIELVAENNPVFTSICIVGIKHAIDETVEAVVVSEQSDAEIDQAIREVNGELASFQHVAGWRRWPDKDFPRTRLLKIDRKKVQEWANEKATTQTQANQAKKPDQDPLLSILRRVVGSPHDHIQDADSLADIGLDSLRRLHVVALIEDELGVTIDEASVTQKTTVEELRTLVAKGVQATPAHTRPSWTYAPWVRLIGNSLREVVIRGLIRIWVRETVEGRKNLDNLSAPAIFIFNHVDDFDAPVIYQALPHRIRKHLAIATADDVMREHKPLAFITRLCFAGFNLNRTEPYLPSLAYACRVIDNGWNVVLAPEGRISVNGKPQPFKSGIGLLAVELGVPVVVVKSIGLHGTVPIHSKWPKKHSRVTVRISEPLTFSEHMDYDVVTKELQTRMENL